MFVICCRRLLEKPEAWMDKRRLRMGEFEVNVLSKSLAETCSQNRYVEKKLLANSYQEGHQLLEAVARGGTAWLNVTPVTAAGLAEEIAGQAIVDENIRIIDDGEILFLIGVTLAEMEKRGKLKYFAELEGLYGPEGILKNALLELRLAGVKSVDIDPAVFVDRQKGEEIKELLAGYELKLRDGKMADRASIYLKAIEVLQNTSTSSEILYMIPEQLEFDFLTYSFLYELTEGKVLVLPGEAVYGLDKPTAFYFKAEPQPKAESQLSWLYDQQGASFNGGPDLDFYKAYSPSCEVKEVFRRLKKDNISVDRATICYTNAEVYLPLIHSIAETCGMPLTYAEGIPVVFTRPGKLLSGLLDWIEDNYSSIHIYRLLCTGGFKTSRAHLLARLLRRAAVGWDRGRYPACLSALDEDIKKELQDAEGQGYDIHYMTVKRDYFPKLQQLISDLLLHVPEENGDGTIQFNQLCLGLAEIIKVYAPTTGDINRLARESMLEMLDQLSGSWMEAVEKRIALKRIKARLYSMRVGASVAAAGCLHVAPVNRAECSDSPYSFVVGLAGEYFPGNDLQDAVLLDRERERISKSLSLAGVKLERNLYNLTRFLASRRGQVVLSYSSFDPVEGRPAFPASILLQAYRLKTRKPGADYSDFLKSLDPLVAYYPFSEANALSVSEWWLSLVLSGSRGGELSSVIDCYPGLRAGLEAEEARCSALFTEFDGKVSVDPAVVDPRRNSNKTLSASAIEKLAGCPYAYFLQNILYIRLPEEQVFDRWNWLDAMERGTLLHKIYARYLRQACSDPNNPKQDRTLLIKIAEEEIAEKKKDTPPPSELVFHSEKNELLRELEFFLKCEAQLWGEGSIPLYMEAPYGRGREAVQEAGAGLVDPLELTLPGGDKISLRGSIDRIDSLPQKSLYRVWDFKTGGKYAYKRGGYIKQGRQIQSVVYAIAAEAILRQRDPVAVVKEAGYLFPTEKGEGERFLRDQGKRGQALNAVELMLDLLAAGAFGVAGKQEPPCKFCDYRAVCRHPQCLDNMEMKVGNPDNSILGPWKELQKYE